ncbi:MAG: hypothetical protein CVV62_02250 [Tenericutes bacterium HGW-Tenericutes-7]|nr:MAG: hypothetical protein CVV62_02250 [Tenericutes bacterium HGW-Tenericutes-7]
MYVDPSGESFILIIAAVLFVMTTVLIVSTSQSAEYISEQPLLLDVSISLLFVKVGFSAVINFEEEYIEFYSHGGWNKGFPSGSVSIGTVNNYKEEGGFSGPFMGGEVGCLVGINHSYDFRDSFNDPVSSSSIVFSTGPLLDEGIDFYYYHKKLTIDWS